MAVMLFNPMNLYAVTVYKWTAPDGSVVFSDEPHENAQKIDIAPTEPAPQTPSKSVATNERTQQTDKQAASKYTSLTISSPAADEVIRANDGSVTVTIQSDPPLNVGKGDRIALTLDGKKIADQLAATSIRLTNVDRGTHQLQASIVSNDGSIRIDSPPVTFHMRRFSKLFSH